MVSPTLVEDLKGWLIAKKADFDSRVYPAMKHGFAARPDTDDSKIKEQYLRAFQDSVAFLKSHV
jgi:dienelactone hydrolase